MAEGIAWVIEEGTVLEKGTNYLGFMLAQDLVIEKTGWYEPVLRYNNELLFKIREAPAWQRQGLQALTE